MIILETERLMLRCQLETDLDAIDAIQSDPQVMKYVGNGKTTSREETEKSIKFWKKYGEEKGYSSWAVVEKGTGRVIGKAGFAELPDKSDVEVFYMFVKDAWGKGYATEISGALIEYGKEKLGLKRIVAFTFPENIPSQNVVKKIGLVRDGETTVSNIRFLRFVTTY